MNNFMKQTKFPNLTYKDLEANIHYEGGIGCSIRYFHSLSKGSFSSKEKCFLSLKRALEDPDSVLKLQKEVVYSKRLRSSH